MFLGYNLNQIESIAIFYPSRYPVILSIENHCSVEQQRIMATDMISILGGELTCNMHALS